MKVSVLFARFPFGASEHPACTDWLLKTQKTVLADPRIDKDRVFNTYVDDTPITMSRNRVLKQAREAGVDLVCMVDSDMVPDNLLGIEDNAVPFWDSSFDHWWNYYKQQPCCIFAPYCGPPPWEIPYIFRLCTRQGQHPNPDWRLEMFSREEAACRTGFEKVDAGPTGLILIDMRALNVLPPPWFDYEWKDKEQTEKGSTEDVVFTRNLAMLGVDQVVNWDAWAGHVKRKTVRKPQVLTSEMIAGSYREALKKNMHNEERTLIMDSSRMPKIVDNRLLTHTNGNGKAHAAKAAKKK